MIAPGYIILAVFVQSYLYVHINPCWWYSLHYSVTLYLCKTFMALSLGFTLYHCYLLFFLPISWFYGYNNFMALNSLLCADVPLRNCSINQSTLQVFLGLPLGLVPSTSYSIHFFTQSLSSFCSTCPYHHNLFHCSTEIMSSNSSLRAIKSTIKLLTEIFFQNRWTK